MAWIESHQGLAKHPKTLKLARKLNIHTAQAIGHLHMFWWWALDYAQDGDISNCDPEDIAIAADWPGDASEFFDALVSVGFIDRHEDGKTTIHDWYDYAGKLIEKRAADAERKRKERSSAAQKQEPAGNPEDVQRTSSGHPEDDQRTSSVTITVPKPNKKHFGDSDECAKTFDRFWAAYPKKHGKQAAWKKWQSLYKQGKIDIDFILDRLQAYITYVEAERRRGFDRQFLDGSTFVNQERWNDDWDMVKPRDPTDQIIELNRRMRDRNEQPIDWFAAK